MKDSTRDNLGDTYGSWCIQYYAFTRCHRNEKFWPKYEVRVLLLTPTIYATADVIASGQSLKLYRPLM